jgi:hypothetical protein
MPDPFASVGVVLSVEHLAQSSGDQAALVAAAVRQHVSDEVHRAPLPGAGQHAGDGVLEPFVLIRDRQPDAGQAAFLQAAQELDPEAAGLDLADVDADHLPQPGLVHRISDDQRFADDSGRGRGP